MAISTLAGLGGCELVGTPLEAELSAIESGRVSLVLLRVRCEVDGQPEPVYGPPSWAEDRLVFFGLGDFESLGNPTLIFPRLLSTESGREGWCYLLLEPGLHYLALSGPGRNAACAGQPEGTPADDFGNQRWRLDVPRGYRSLYVGTIEVRGTVTGHLLFGGRIVDQVDSRCIPIGDDRRAAAQLLSQFVPGLSEPVFIPLQRWQPGETVIIRSTPPTTAPRP